jgi:hypothetical protein
MYFAASLGYKWVLQLDDDACLIKEIPYDIVGYLESKNAWLGARTIVDNHLDMAWGLPELARYYIVSENVKVRNP